MPGLAGPKIDMYSVYSESINKVLSSHRIWNLYPSEVPVALFGLSYFYLPATSIVKRSYSK